MERGVSLFLIILILSSNIVYSLNLNEFSSMLDITSNAVKENEKSLIELCKFKSTGPEVVMQKTESNQVLIWLYELDKERFGELKLITDFEKVNENKYNFRVEENGPIYTVKAVIPDFCVRFKESILEKENNIKQVCATNPILTITSVNVGGRELSPGAYETCVYQNYDNEFLSSSATTFPNYGAPVNGKCPSSLCREVEEAQIVIQTTTPVISVHSSESVPSRSQEDNCPVECSSNPLISIPFRAIKSISLFFANILLLLFLPLFSLMGINIKPFSQNQNDLFSLAPVDCSKIEACITQLNIQPKYICVGRSVNDVTPDFVYTKEDVIIRESKTGDVINTKEDYCSNGNKINEVFCINKKGNTVEELQGIKSFDCTNGCDIANGVCKPEKKCREETVGDFNGKVQRVLATNIHRYISILPDYDKTFQGKQSIFLMLPMVRTTNDASCGLPVPGETATITFVSEGPSFTFINGEYENAAVGLRGVILNFLNKHTPSFYTLIKGGIIGKGGVLIDQDKNDPYHFIGIDRNRVVWDYFTNKELSGYFYFTITVAFKVKGDFSGVDVTVKEDVIEDKDHSKLILIDNTYHSFKTTIPIQEYIEYIDNMIYLVNGLNAFGENYKLVLENKVPDIDDYVNGGSSDPVKMKDATKTKITVDIKENLDRGNLDQYKEKTQCCN